MAPKHATPDCDTVLSELGWLKRLARGLGADPHLADDLTQATFLTALEHPPATERPVRGWLRTVLQNLLAETKRRRLRREAREARAARPEADGSAADIVERAAVQKQVVDAVMTLEEPYRTTVLLRFFENLPPRKIAARTGTPVATVKTRLARGLEQLRSRLDREHGGDRHAWLLCLLAPLPKAALATSAIGVVIVQTKLKLAAGLAAVLLIGVGGWFAFDRFGDRPARPATSGGESVSDTTSPRTAAASPAEGATPIIRPRAYVEPADATSTLASRPDSAPATARADTAPSTARIRGRVIDTRSAPVAGVQVVFDASKTKASVPDATAASSSHPSAISGPGGIFEIDAPPLSGAFVAKSPVHATVLVGNFDAQATAVEPVIVVAPLRKLAGRVVDGDHRPLPGAQVGVKLPPNFRSQFDRILDYSEDARLGAKTDADGRFAFDSAPDLEGAKIAARLEGWEERIEEMPAAAVSEIEIVLQRTTPVRDTVTGQVVDHGGVGVPAARVSTGDRTTLADEAGRFTIKFDEGRPPETLTAVKDGYLPAVAQVTGEAPVVLRLDGSPLTIAGKVVDQDGKALAGIKVWTADPTLFAAGDEGIEFVENLLGNPKARFWGPVDTTDDGRFLLRGLMARDYIIKAMDPKTLAQEDAGAVKAGSTDVVITFGGADFFENVGGTVVSLGGIPVPNVKVQPVRDVFTYQVDEGGSSTQHADTAGTVTDEAGRFKLGSVPKKGVYLHFEGPNTIPRDLGRESGIEEEAKGQALDRLRIEVPVRCHMQVDLGARADFADHVSILDSAGQPVPIEIFFGNGRMTTTRVAITDGRTGVLAVPENTATVIFMKAEKEVDRKRIRVVPGQVTTVRP